MMHQYSGLVLLAVFADGFVAGMLLVAWIIQFRQTLRRYTIRRKRAIEEQAALRALEERPVEIDDDCMLCPLCWEDRHPGQVWWSVHIGSYCAKHKLEAPPETRREEHQDYVLWR
jgi:hypothetical protein